jgi:iron complex transport system substrate-binding protein
MFRVKTFEAPGQHVFSPFGKKPCLSVLRLFEAVKAGLFILAYLHKKQNFSFAASRLCGRFLAFICLSVGVFFFTNCQSENPQAQNDTTTREVTDDLGRKIRIPEKPERVVSLAPNLTESIFAVGAGDKLIGVTSFCNYPADAQKIQKIGDTLNPNMETIIALKPQIVFVSTASQIETFAKTLENQNIAVYVTNPENLDGVLSNLKQLGDILGTSAKADVLAFNLQKRIAAVESEIKDENKIKVFVQISKEPLFTIGKESFLTEIIERAGGVSVTKDVATAYPKLSKETALALNPEAIILSDSEDNREPNDVFKSSSAVKNGKVFKINADLLSRPAPRIVDALEQIAADLH